jgi:hypothetical protein
MRDVRRGQVSDWPDGKQYRPEPQSPSPPTASTAKLWQRRWQEELVGGVLLLVFALGLADTSGSANEASDPPCGISELAIAAPVSCGSPLNRSRRPLER